LSSISSLTTFALKAKASSAGNRSFSACANADINNKNKGNKKRFTYLSQVLKSPL